MKTNTLFCLKGMYATLTPTERRLADYFFDNAANLPRTPMLDIAKACDTSKPAVVRLCKKLGFSGYKEFLTTLSAEQAITAHDNRPDFFSLTPESSADDICRAVAYWEIAALEDIVLHVDSNHVEDAVQLLRKAPRIDLCGLGSGMIAVRAAHRGLGRAGMNPYLSADVEEQLKRMSSLGQDDVLMVLSDIAQHKELVAGAARARQNGARVIAMLRRTTPEAEQVCDVIIQYAAANAPEEFCSIATRTALMGAVDMLIALAIFRGVGLPYPSEAIPPKHAKKTTRKSARKPAP